MTVKINIDTIVKKIEKTYDVKIVAYADQSKRNYVNMEKIKATTQGKGEGTKALRAFIQLCKSAGFGGITISVHPLDGFKTTTADDVERLIMWYLKNGFKLTRTNPIPQMEIKFKGG